MPNVPRTEDLHEVPAISKGLRHARQPVGSDLAVLGTHDDHHGKGTFRFDCIRNASSLRHDRRNLGTPPLSQVYSEVTASRHAHDMNATWINLPGWCADASLCRT